MTPKKKPDDKPIEVSVASVSPGIERTHEDAIRSNAWRERVWMAVIGAIVALASIGQTIAVTYMQSQTRDAVAVGTSQTRDAVAKGALEVREQTKEVADSLTKSTTNTQEQLAYIEQTSTASHDLANSFMLAMKKKLAETSRRLADMTKDPEDIARAEVEEAAYEAHRVTDERMRAEKEK